MLPLREKDGFETLRSALLNPVSDTECEYFFDALIVAENLNGQTTIVEVGEAHAITQKRGWQLEEFPKLEGIILPAFYDVHFHWVQDDVRQSRKCPFWNGSKRIPFLKRPAFPTTTIAKPKQPSLVAHNIYRNNRRALL